MKFTLFVVGLFSALAMAAPAPEAEPERKIACPRDGVFCEVCIGGDQNCISCEGGVMTHFLGSC